MDFKDIVNKSLEIRRKYENFEINKFGKAWEKEQIFRGFIGDIGDLSKLITAKEGLKNIENVNEKLAHELSDCLWSIIILADKYGVDLESSLLKTLDELEKRI